MTLTGKDISEIPGVLELVEGQCLEEIREKSNKFIQKPNSKCSKIGFLNSKKGN